MIATNHSEPKPVTPTEPTLAQEDAPQEARPTTDLNRHFGPSTFLNAIEIKQLSRMSPIKLSMALGFDFALIAAAVLVAELSGSGLVYVLAAMTIGARQAGIGSVGLHDGVHHLLLKNRVWNDRLGRLLSWLTFAQLIVGFSSYRKDHFQHHRSANTHDDPDIELAESFYRASRWKACIAFVAPLTGLFFIVATARYLWRNTRSKSLCSILLSTGILVLAWGLAYESYLAHLLFWYWVVPIGTWGIFVNQLRSMAEHYPEDEFGRNEDTPEVFRTRDIINSWFDRWFVVTRGVNYHLSHHLCPQVPFYNLAKLQIRLAANPLYGRYAHVTHGYHRVLAEYFFQRHEEVGQLNAAL